MRGPRSYADCIDVFSHIRARDVAPFGCPIRFPESDSADLTLGIETSG